MDALAITRMILRLWHAADAAEAPRHLDSTQIDWDSLRVRLTRQGLLALVGSGLQRVGIEGVPEQFVGAWQLAFRRNRRRGAFMNAALRPILDALAAHGVRVMVMRTPYLVDVVYGGRYGLRAFSDVDLAVEPKDITDTADVLNGGFPDCALRGSDVAKTVRKADAGGRLECVVNGIPLDVHWELTLFYNFHRSRARSERQRGIWRRARMAEGPWGRAWVMSPEDLVCHLAEHCVIQHDLGDTVYRGIFEFARTLSLLGADPKRIEECADERGSRSALQAASIAACDLFQPEDATLLRYLSRSAWPPLTRCVRKRLDAASGEVPRQTNGLWGSVRQTLASVETEALLADGTDTRLALVRSLALPSRRILSYALDRTLSWPAYALALLFYPIAQVLLLRAYWNCLRRQAWDIRRGIKNSLRRFLYMACGVAFSAAYYAGNLRNTGLVGPGAAKTWLRRLWPRPPANPSGGSRVAWLHVAGPGDARAAAAFLDAIQKHEPGRCFWVTCGTRPSYDYMERLSHKTVVGVDWLPFDLPFAVRRTLRRLRPALFIGMQGEFWPNLIRALRRCGIPSIFLRVDMLDWETQREFPNWVRPLYEEMLGEVSAFSARGSLYRDRLLKSGVRADRVVVGRDYRISGLLLADPEVRTNYTSLFGLSGGTSLVIMACPRIDEIQSIVAHLREPLIEGAFRLMIAPAELDVCSQTEHYLRRQGIAVVRRTQLTGEWQANPVILLDTWGELRSILAIATLAIVGDTFPPSFAGGRNVWEALSQGCPAIYGPEMVVTEALSTVESQRVARRVPNLDAMDRVLQEALADPFSREQVREAVNGAIQGEGNAAGLDAELVSALIRREENYRSCTHLVEERAHAVGGH